MSAIGTTVRLVCGERKRENESRRAKLISRAKWWVLWAGCARSAAYRNQLTAHVWRKIYDENSWKWKKIRKTIHWLKNAFGNAIAMISNLKLFCVRFHVFLTMFFHLKCTGYLSVSHEKENEHFSSYFRKSLKIFFDLTFYFARWIALKTQSYQCLFSLVNFTFEIEVCNKFTLQMKFFEPSESDGVTNGVAYEWYWAWNQSTWVFTWFAIIFMSIERNFHWKPINSILRSPMKKKN